MISIWNGFVTAVMCSKHFPKFQFNPWTWVKKGLLVVADALASHLLPPAAIENKSSSLDFCAKLWIENFFLMQQRHGHLRHIGKRLVNVTYASLVTWAPQFA